MTKQEIQKDMRAYVGGGFITRTQFAAYMGMKDPRKAKEKFLDGLERVDGKYYFIPDVAKVLYERRTND
jgi:hypothetical protein